jgi:hypothetical protein
MSMRTMTAGRLAEGIRSYRDIVNAHRVLVAKVAAGKGSIYAEAAARVARLAELYRTPETLTVEMRTAAEDAFTAVDEAHRVQHPSVDASPFLLADARLDYLALLVQAPTDGR